MAVLFFSSRQIEDVPSSRREVGGDRGVAGKDRKSWAGIPVKGRQQKLLDGK